jgi:predicted transcriptional regulator
MAKTSLDKLMQIFANPTRSAILYELTRYEECSATDLAKILNQKVNNIYYHLRILENDGIVNSPRSVVKLNYVEKYYSLSQKFLASVNVDKFTWKQSQKKLPIEQRRDIAITALNLITSILRWRTEEYKQMSKEQMDKLWSKEEEWVTLSTFTQEQYEVLVKRLEKTWLETMKEFGEIHSKQEKPFTVIIAALSELPARMPLRKGEIARVF